MHISKKLAGAAVLSLTLTMSAQAQDADRAKALFETGTQLLSESDLLESKELRRNLRIRAAESFFQASEISSGEMAQDSLLKSAAAYRVVGDEESMSKSLAGVLLIAQRFPKSKSTPKALVLRGDLFADAKEWGRAIKAWNRVSEEYADSDAAPDALYKAGQVFAARIRNLDEARKAYTTVLAKYAKSEVADDALFARAVIQEGEKDLKAAVTDYLDLVQRYPDSTLADTAMYNAIMIREKKLKELREAHDLAVEFRKQFPHSKNLKSVEEVEQRTLKYVTESK